MLLVFWLGCAPQGLDILFEQPTCEQPPSEEPFVVETNGSGGIFAQRHGVERGCTDVFSPTVSINDDLLVIREYWEEGQVTDCTTCFAPTVSTSELSGREVEVHWIVGDADFPEVIVELSLR